jgi:hypothetical protein
MGHHLQPALAKSNDLAMRLFLKSGRIAGSPLGKAGHVVGRTSLLQVFAAGCAAWIAGQEAKHEDSNKKEDN